MEYKLNIPDEINIQGLFGNYDANIRSVEKFTGTEMNLRDGELTIKGRDPELAARIIASGFAWMKTTTEYLTIWIIAWVPYRKQEDMWIRMVATWIATATV